MNPKIHVRTLILNPVPKVLSRLLFNFRFERTMERGLGTFFRRLVDVLVERPENRNQESKG
ncbi:hypothetical protein MAR_034021 [Mya arenaria]|uniref:Uncharacterized protein n=1 Tax=Mya arenaria TaxID=6604 RepID=A0ABY7GDR6_MYAAR|nr:hypothetical protein MAR_034021 [Mya arenaria]